MIKSCEAAERSLIVQLGRSSICIRVDIEELDPARFTFLLMVKNYRKKKKNIFSHLMKTS